MMFRKTFAAVSAVFLLFSVAMGQKAEVTISLNEAFFDGLLDSVFQNFEPPQISIAKKLLPGQEVEPLGRRDSGPKFSAFTSSETPPISGTRSEKPFCDESVKILREMNGVHTAVRFREGKIYVPLAFSGSYNPPFVGCVDFAGWAEANIELEFDRTGQRLIARAKVLNVNLNGTAGLGGGMIAKLLQGSIDKKLNPFEVLSLEKATFLLPIPKTGNVKMKAIGIRHEVVNASLNIAITYQFLKG